MMASSALNNIFMTYFLSALLGDGENDGHDGCAGHGRRAWLRGTLELTPTSFFVAQACYALWNATNDPLMGWISDRCTCPCLFRSLGGGRGSALARRARAIRWGGVAWAIAFALAWFPPPLLTNVNGPFRSYGAGLHYFFALSFYDTALSLVEVNHAAVLAELKGGEPARAHANSAAAIGAAIGALTAFPAHLAWQADCTIVGETRGALSWPGPFRTFCISLAIIAAIVLLAAAQTLDTASQRAMSEDEEEDEEKMMKMTNQRLPVQTSLNDESLRKGNRGAAAPRHAATGVSSSAAAAASSSSTISSSFSALVPSVTSTLTTIPSNHTHLSYVTFITRAASLPAARTYMCIATLQAFDCALGKSFFASFLTILASPPHSAGGSGISLPPVTPPHLAVSPLSAAKVPISSFASSPATGLPWLLSLFPHNSTIPRSSLFSDTSLAAVVAASFLLPHIFTVLTANDVAARGVPSVLRSIFITRAMMAIVACISTLIFTAVIHIPSLSDILVSPSTLYIRATAVITYQLLSRVSSEAVCRAMPLAKARLIDAAVLADTERDSGGTTTTNNNSAPLPLAAALGGAADFFPKIAASIAPLIGYSVVRLGSTNSSWGGSESGGTDSLSNAVWFTLILIPFLVSISQLLCGSFGEKKK